MKRTFAAFGMVLLVAAAVGCTTVIEGNWEPPPEGSDKPATTVRVHLAEGSEIAAPGLAGKGTLAAASKVVLLKLGADGTLTELAITDVGAGGGLDVAVPSNLNPGEVLVLQVQNISGAILGSTVLNGVPAFFKGFLIDVPVDTATSFKTEILMTMANGGVPGVQNYLNVVNTFVDAELAGTIAVFNAFVLDFNSLFGAFATAAIATNGLIAEQLEAAGLPIDADAITDAQMMALAGMQGQITTAAGQIVTNSKNFVAQLQEATANAAKPVDEAIFNALTGGNAMFKSSFKVSMAANASTAGAQDTFSFPLVKAGVKLQVEVARDQIDAYFRKAGMNNDAMAMYADASAKYVTQVEQASDVAALTAAKSEFKAAMFGRQDSMQGSFVEKVATVVFNLQATMNNVKATMDPLGANLQTSLAGSNLTAAQIKSAIATFDAGAQGIPAKLESVTTAQNAAALAKALETTEKMVLP